MSDLALRDAFKETNFEMVATGAQDKYELPVSEGPSYRLGRRVDPELVKDRLSSRDYSFIAPHTDLNYLSSKVYDAETNQFLHVKVTGDLMRVFPKDEDLSFETFKRFVETVEEHAVELEYEPTDFTHEPGDSVDGDAE